MQMVPFLSKVYSQVGMQTEIGERMVLTLKFQYGKKGSCCWMHSHPCKHCFSGLKIIL